ncbi:hypothetical protein HHO41_21055 [Bacillus sp. DNRA2]|uniref:hypothetical protein n=1 Tax=Bacillus sp. DNRA2 TaxID=2723053 RepID=UPI00145CCFDC|nr:hypothetical protein [Bacillus sp. DNRA2]NMD72719.1 hypothetical protein [Bacillus sp. DNRA2]
MLKKLIINLCVAVFLIGLTGCETASIIDIIHPVTEDKELSKSNFSDPELKPYLIEGVLFNPYMRQGDTTEIGEDYYYHYYLRLAVYKHPKNTSAVTVNSVKIVGGNDVTFKDVYQDISTPLEFTIDEKHESIQVSDGTLIEEINDYNMNLTDNSKLKLTLNVSVESNGKTMTRDLTYVFETRTRTFNVMR